jgi:hypothetical protein
VNVTVSVELAPTIKAVVSVCEVPLVAVAYRHATVPCAAVQLALVVVSDELVYPVAYVVLVGRLTAVMVTGAVPALEIVTTASPNAPGYTRFAGVGIAVAVIVRLATLAAWLSPLDPALTPTVQLVAP